MEKENYETLESSLEFKFRNVKNFRELFALLNSSEFDESYREAYEETVQIAKYLIETKSKSSWNSTEFNTNIKIKYPNISQDFVNTLKKCVDGYNPIVNLPLEPLW